MAKFYDALNPTLREFIAEQHMFFNASAAATGRINLSPKGMDTFRILDDSTVAYLDLTGSGNESAAHLLADGRMTIMFCSFAGRPWILRLYGHGESIKLSTERGQELAPLFPMLPGARQIILLHVESVQTSCGYAVPLYEFQQHREVLTDWAEKKGEAGIQEYWEEKNTVSIDGLPTGLLAGAPADVG